MEIGEEESVSGSEEILEVGCSEGTYSRDLGYSSYQTGYSYSVERYYSTNTGSVYTEERRSGDIGDEEMDAEVGDEGKGKKKKKKLLKIVVPVVVVVILLLVAGTTVPLLVLKKPVRDGIPIPKIQDGTVDEEYTYSVIPDFVFETVPPGEYGECALKMRYRMNNNEWSKWKKYSREIDAALVGTLELEFKYVCRKGESNSAPLRLTVDNTLPDIEVEGGEVVGSRWSLCLKGDKDIKSFDVYQGGEAMSVCPEEEEGHSLHSPCWDKECTGIVLLKEGEYKAVAVVETDKTDIERRAHFRVLPFDSSIINDGVLSVPEETVVLKKEFLEGLGLFMSVRIGGLVEDIEYDIFRESNVEEITVDGENKEYAAEDGVLFTKDLSELIVCPAGRSEGSYTIPGRTEVILSRAFAGTSLASVALPSTLTKIEEGAFEGCNLSLRLLVEGARRETKLTLSDILLNPDTNYINREDAPGGTFTLGVEVALLPKGTLPNIKLETCVPAGTAPVVYGNGENATFEAGSGTRHVALSTTLCLVDKGVYIPLFENDEEFAIKVDTGAPSVTLMKRKRRWPRDPSASQSVTREGLKCQVLVLHKEATRCL